MYDCYFFLNDHTSINKDIVEYRMGIPLIDYILKCADAIQNFSSKEIMSNIGELVDGKEKIFAKTKLKDETVSLLRFFAEFPSIQKYPDSNMIVNQATIVEQVDNHWGIKAIINNNTYSYKELSPTDQQRYLNLNNEDKKRSLAKILARKYFISEWNQRQ